MTSLNSCFQFMRYKYVKSKFFLVSNRRYVRQSTQFSFILYRDERAFDL